MSASGQVTPRERELLALLAERDRVIEQLQARVTELEARLGQTPRNSSRPPSSEGCAKPPAERQERRAGGRRRRPGKQPGSGGAHLAQTAEPDEVVWHSPDGCWGCGADLDEAEVVAESARQVFDVPEPVVRVIEHRVLRRRCGLCHAMTAARFPDEASAPACCGPRVRALVAYFSAASDHAARPTSTSSSPPARPAARPSDCCDARLSDAAFTALRADAHLLDQHADHHHEQEPAERDNTLAAAA